MDDFQIVRLNKLIQQFILTSSKTSSNRKFSQFIVEFPYLSSHLRTLPFKNTDHFPIDSNATITGPQAVSTILPMA